MTVIAIADALPHPARRLLACGMLLAALAGCAGQARREYPALTMQRETDGSVLDVMPPYPVACQDDPDRERIALTWSRRSNRFKESVYEIGVVNTGRTPLAVAGGESLKFHLDTHWTVCRTFGTTDALRSDGRTIPIAATYIVLYADLQEIASAHMVQVTLDANQQPFDRCFDAGGIANLRRFIKDYPPE